MPEQQRAQWMEPYARRVEGEPTTEAGKRLLGCVPGSMLHPDDRLWCNAHRRPIEACEAVAAERKRIRAAVEGLFDSPALYPSFWGDTIRKENEVVRAVLRIIDEG